LQVVLKNGVQFPYAPLKNKQKNRRNKGCGRIKLKLERIENRKKEIGSKHRRKLKKYSENFNRMFYFFYSLNRKDLIDFCGTPTIIHFDINGPDCKECFRLYEDGFYKGGKPIVSRHPNILKSVLIGKKGWGLWCNEWSSGIVEWSFTKEEILNEFKIRNIEIPDSFLREFENLIEKKKKIRNELYLKSLN